MAERIYWPADLPRPAQQRQQDHPHVIIQEELPVAEELQLDEAVRASLFGINPPSPPASSATSADVTSDQMNASDHIIEIDLMAIAEERRVREGLERLELQERGERDMWFYGYEKSLKVHQRERVDVAGPSQQPQDAVATEGATTRVDKGKGRDTSSLPEPEVGQKAEAKDVLHVEEDKTWHEGYTCEEYRELPDDERGEDDRKLQQLASNQNWRRCGQCRMMVEKAFGCNHITCRCGNHFCYKCGSAWSYEFGCTRQPRCPTYDNVVANNEDLGYPFGLEELDMPVDDMDELIQDAMPVIANLDDIVRQLIGQPNIPDVPEQPAPVNPNAAIRLNQEQRPPLRLIELYENPRTRRRLQPWLSQALSDKECVYCNRKFETLRALEMHLGMTKRHMVWICCGKIFRNERDMENHVRDHGVEWELVGPAVWPDIDGIANNFEENADADLWGIPLFVREANDQRAKLDLTSAVQGAEADGENASIPRWLRDRRCIYCGDSFLSVRGLERHLKTVQKHAVHVCCNKVFRHPAALERHRLKGH
ncbi:hypothetical protein HDV00_010287 [Rhizophlyctis rosea]|nr:hypothetical protein HDV00_010287 [Rhizophlyctis rosea]